MKSFFHKYLPQTLSVFLIAALIVVVGSIKGSKKTEAAVTVSGSVTAATDSSFDSGSASHTVVEGTDLLVVFLQGWLVGEAQPPTSVTWSVGSQSLTRISLAEVTPNWVNDQHSLWYLANPNSGSGTLSWSGGDASLEDGGVIHAINLDGVDLTVGTSGIRDVDIAGADTRTTITLSPTSVSGDLILTQWSQQLSTQTTGQTYGGTSGTQSVQNGTGFNIDAAFLTTSYPTGSGQNITFLELSGANYPSGVAISVAAETAAESSNMARINIRGGNDSSANVEIRGGSGAGTPGSVKFK